MEEANRNNNTTSANNFFVYIGTYTNRNDEGLYVCSFDSEKGRLTAPKLAVELLNPNFIAISPNNLFLYTVGDSNSSDSLENGCVNSFSLCRKTGNLSPIKQVSSYGKTPCHITIDKTGKYALVSNYTTGSLAVFPISDDGHLSEPATVIQHTGSSIDPSRQTGPHIHSITLDGSNRYALAADLGQDKIFVYHFDQDNGTLKPSDMPYIPIEPGSGPRHFTFGPSGNYAYIVNEMSNTITAFKYDQDSGILNDIGTIPTLPADYKGQSYTSEIQTSPSGKYLYTANRGHDSIAIFEINSKNGKLALIDIQTCGGKWPHHFCIDPTGKWLLIANERSDKVSLFRIDPTTGMLNETSNSPTVPSPACIKLCPALDN